MVPLCRIHVTRASSDAMRASSYFITREGAHVKLPIELHVGKGRKGGGPAENREDASGITTPFKLNSSSTDTAHDLKSLEKAAQSIKSRLEKLLFSLKSRLKKFILL